MENGKNSPAKAGGHDYKLEYDVRFKAGHFTAEDLRARGMGGTDGLIFISCIEHEDGSYSQTFESVDGATNDPMETDKLAKAWLLLGGALQNRSDLGALHRAAISEVFRMFREAMSKNIHRKHSGEVQAG